MVRGMLITVYCKPTRETDTKELTEIYRDFYDQEPFVQILCDGELPRTKNVWGPNRCEIAVRSASESSTVLIVSVIDNLVKGASGQAVQNMNVVFELPEPSGLESLALYP
jgi:N-acetyl-gamma-glutamyl-phosphate reductase